MTKEERNKLVMENIKLVHKVANRYKTRARLHGFDYNDVFNTGVIGLIKAIDNYDPTYGYMLSTYAVPKIKGEIQLLLRDYTRGPHFGRSVKVLRARIVRANLEDTQYTTISEQLGASIQEVVAAMELIHGPLTFDYDTFDTKDGNDNISYYELIPDGTDFTDDVVINAFVSKLSMRDKFIFVSTLDEKTQTEIGHTLGISQAHVNRLLSKIRMSLNEYLGRNVG